MKHDVLLLLGLVAVWLAGLAGGYLIKSQDPETVTVTQTVYEPTIIPQGGVTITLGEVTFEVLPPSQPTVD